MNLVIRTVVFAAIAAAVAACSTDTSSAPQKTYSTLSECLADGAWLSPGATCTGARTPEATASDCQSVAFVEYQPEGKLLEGVYTYSASKGTMSGTYLAQSYTLAGAELKIQPGSHTFKVTCDSATLTADLQSQSRAPQNIAAALQGATAKAGGSFASVAVAR